MSDRILYDKPSAAEALGISVRVLERLIGGDDPELPTVVVGRRRLVHRDDLEAYGQRLRTA